MRTAELAVAILPWGATEAHNTHLPYGTDTAECDHLAAACAGYAWDKGARVIVLPTVPFGVNTGQLDIPFCLNMNPSTQAALLADIVHSLEPHGVEKLVIINGHGGNDFRQMIRELQPHTPIFLCAVNWYQAVNPADYFEQGGDHAGELETSVMMHLEPDLVRPLGQAGSGAARRFKIAALREGWAWAPRHWTSVTDDTGVGDPRASTADKGARYVAEVTRKIGDFLVQLAAADPEEMYE